MAGVDTALGLTGLLMGLAGSPHCVAMCGAACGGIARGCGGDRPQRAMVALQAGRLVSYAAAGALAAASVSTLGQWAGHAAALRPFWGLLHAAALVLGLWLLWRGRQPAWLEGFGRRLGRSAAPGRVVWLNGPVRAAALGSLWAAWPCGLLQSALVVASLGSGAWNGAWIMSAFAVGSATGLWLGPMLWLKLASDPGRAAALQTAAVRLAGLTLALASAWALWNGLMTQIGRADLCL